MNVQYVGLLSAALVFLALAFVALRMGKPHLQSTLFALACGATTLWAAAAAVGLRAGPAVEGLDSFLDAARGLAWLTFLGSLLSRSSPGLAMGRARPFMLVAVVLAAATTYGLLTVGQIVDSVARWLFLGLAILGLILIENVHRNLPLQRQWGFKFLFIGMGSLFLFDALLNAAFLLPGELDLQLRQARGAVYALSGVVLGFALYRTRLWRAPLSLSRQIAFYAATLVASIVAVALVSVVGLYIRQFGGTAATAIQAIFLFASGMLLVAVLLSGTVRAYLKVLIDKHFFAYGYDYRTEWLRFTNTVAQSRPSTSLEERVIRAIADVVESPAGGLWYRHGDRFAIAWGWNMVLPSIGRAESQILEGFLTRTGWIVEVQEVSARPEKYGSFRTPKVLDAMKDAWIIVPLLHHAMLNGFVVLAKPRAPKSLGWEDYDILKTIARQAASYLAEQKSAEALAELRELERFNRRSAFVMHDIKNLVSQLSMVCSNFRRHGDNEEFRKDMIATVESVVVKMNRMLERLSFRMGVGSADSATRLKALVQSVLQIERGAAIELRWDPIDRELCVAGDPDRVEALIGHVLGNAVEAIDEQGLIHLDVHAADGMAVIEITDNGSGMESSFVQDEYFKLFQSTKRNGFGMGGYQCREYARELGGDLSVLSCPGSGTTVRISLPIVAVWPALDGSTAVSG